MSVLSTPDPDSGKRCNAQGVRNQGTIRAGNEPDGANGLLRRSKMDQEVAGALLFPEEPTVERVWAW